MTPEGGRPGGRGWRRRRVWIPSAVVVACAVGGAAAALVLTRPAGGLRVSPAVVRLLVGSQGRLAATWPGGRGPVRWQSSAPQVVRVSADGRVRALATGQATVTATERGHSGTALVTTVGIRRLTLHLPGTIGYGQAVPLQVTETLTDGSTPRTAPIAVQVALPAGAPLTAVGHSLLGSGLGITRVAVRGPDGPPATERVQVVPAVPTNVGTVTPGFVAHAPLVVQVDNGPTSDPHTGLQAADVVYEYATEGGITRFTAVFWHLSPAATVGPIRSARLIVIPVQQMYRGLAVFSGASNGTYANLYHDRVPLVSDDCCGQDFFRTTDHVAPSNLFTQGRLLLGALRGQFPALAAERLPYVLLPPHVDPLTPGPLRIVTVEQTPVNVPAYHYNPVGRTWQRWLNGTPQVDTTTGQPIAVRNLIVLTAPWHYTNYVEDVLGNYSIDWVLTASGPFQAFIDGLQFQGTWHRPAGGGPIVYTMADGRPLPLATGLTWVEVVAAGTTVTATG